MTSHITLHSSQEDAHTSSLSVSSKTQRAPSPSGIHRVLWQRKLSNWWGSHAYPHKNNFHNTMSQRNTRDTVPLAPEGSLLTQQTTTPYHSHILLFTESIPAYGSRLPHSLQGSSCTLSFWPTSSWFFYPHHLILLPGALLCSWG